MFIFYFASTVLGAAALTVLIILHMSRKDAFLNYLIASVIFCLIMMVIDAMFFQFYDSGAGDEEMALWPGFLFDFSFYAFILFWIMTMSSINGGRNIIPVKVLIPVFAAMYISYEITIAKESYQPAMILAIIFDALLLTNGIYFVICGIREKERYYGKRVLIAAGISMAAYAAWLLYQDYSLHTQLISGTLVEWSHDYMVVMAIAFEVILLAYFFYVDPLNIKEKNKVENLDADIREQYDLTEREEEIVEMILEGLSNPQIADKAFISENTVKKHLTNIYKKTGTTSRYDLIVKLESK